ncbi:hypothetical protein C8Q74DRAFT_1213735 [Fomes fomentarius]|nr:hypothetical protein C8Q74DRAFT_1213735 [Fomes fomentarius]
MVASSIHPASLVDPSAHSPALLELVEMEMSRTLIEHLVDTVVETVDYAMGRPSSSTTIRGRTMSRHSEHSKFLKFVSDVLHKAEVKVPALLVTLVYIERAKPHIQIALEQWANERVFLGALILANKYLNDSTLKNVHWALCTGVFGKRDIGRIEREFLDVLDFELSVSEADLLAHHDTILALSRPHHARAQHQHLHQNKHHARRTSSPLGSRWSTDSSDMDVDSESSFDSVSLPRTPEPLSSAAVPFPTKVELDFAPNTHAHDDASHDHLHAHSHSQSHNRVRASALSILRSFPLPQFHSSQPHVATPAPSQAYRHSLAPQPMPVRA